ncbi:MAG: hypothetical protein AB1793_09530 [Candidatus Thermoplasmatota archaeon]
MLWKTRWSTVATLLVVGGLALLLPGFASAQGGTPPPSPIDQWHVSQGGTTQPIQNNQNPGNYKVKNDGVSPVTVTVKDASGQVVATAELASGDTSGQLGVPQGGSVTIADGDPPNNQGASGTIWKV